MIWYEIIAIIFSGIFSIFVMWCGIYEMTHFVYDDEFFEYLIKSIKKYLKERKN